MPSKPRLTNRVLRGILNIEKRCGGPFERGEAPDTCSVGEWDDAQAAIDWAHQMIAYRAAEGE
jgi:hypothetical protein